MSFGSGFRRYGECCLIGLAVGAISGGLGTTGIAWRLAGYGLLTGGIAGLIVGAILPSLVSKDYKGVRGDVALWAALVGVFLAPAVMYAVTAGSR